MAPFFPPRLISSPGPVLPETYTSKRAEGEWIRPNVLIAMSRFNKVIYNEKDKTVQAGAGTLWQDVYNVVWKLTPPRDAVGGAGIVGLAGYLLGGGYSALLTNQFGLGIDNIAGFEVVLPSGDVVDARPNGDSADLYNALRVISWCSSCFLHAHSHGRGAVQISAS
jgi:FAD/FMN-containing dehydrogenase